MANEKIIAQKEKEVFPLLKGGDGEAERDSKNQGKKSTDKESSSLIKEGDHEVVEDLKKPDSDLWERVISQIQSSTTRQVFKDHMTIDKVTDNEVSLIHDNNMIAKTMLEKDHKEIEALLEKELGRKVTLNVQ